MQRGARITVNSHDRKSGRIHSVKNVLVRIGRCSEHFFRHCDGRTLHQNGDAVAAAALSVSAEAPPLSSLSVSTDVSEVGYCLQQKISKSVYGSVFKCVVMKRRKLFLKDTAKASASGGGGISYRNEGSLESISEGEEDGDRYSEDEFSVGKIVWEPTGDIVAVKVGNNYSFVECYHLYFYRGRRKQSKTPAGSILASYNNAFTHSAWYHAMRFHIRCVPSHMPTDVILVQNASDAGDAPGRTTARNTSHATGRKLPQSHYRKRRSVAR